MSTLGVLFAVLLPQGTHQGAALPGLGERALTPRLRLEATESSPAGHPTVIERHAAARRAESRRRLVNGEGF